MRIVKTFILLSVLASLSCLAQQKHIIAGRYDNVPLDVFLKEIEVSHGVRFYYVDAAIKGIVVTANFEEGVSLKTALDMILQPHGVACQISEGAITLYKSQNTINSISEFVTLRGRVIDAKTSGGIPFAFVAISSLGKHTTANDSGYFEMPNVKRGTHRIEFSSLGFTPYARNVHVIDGGLINFGLDEAPQQLPEILITPSAFEISGDEGSSVSLGKQEIVHSPNLAKDIYRTLRAVPGIANSDFSAKARIRGGHSDETAVYLDNFLINEPFHLEEVDGSFSIFNSDYIDEMTVLTGSFSPKYTDRLSGVLDVKTKDNAESDSYNASVDLLNASLLVQKRIGKVNTFVTARRGYLDFLLKDMVEGGETQLKPKFSDMWAKASVQVHNKHYLTFNILYGRDNFSIRDQDGLSSEVAINNKRNNLNGWANWKWFPSKNFSSIATAGVQVNDKKATFIFPETISIANRDNIHSSSFVLTYQSFLQLDNSKSIEAGFESRIFNTALDYSETRYAIFNTPPEPLSIDDINIANKITGATGAAYGQLNWKVMESLMVQGGLRTSFQSYARTPQVAPRFAVRYDISQQISFKAGYGFYYQPDLYFKPRTSLAQRSLYNNTNKAIHYSAALNFAGKSTTFLINAYYKDYRILFDDFRFEYFNRMVGANIPDISFETNSGVAKGLEFMVRQQYGRSMVTISYTRSSSKIRNRYGFETNRDFDQPHNITVNNVFRLPHYWNISFLWNYHTGFPYTPTSIDYVHDRPGTEGIIVHYEAGLKNTMRLPVSHTLDIRFEKTWHFRKSNLMAYLNIVNFYNRENVRGYWWSPYQNRNGGINFDRETQTNIPFFLSPGISYTIF
ncbi:MAG: TonB-dependent receptor [Chryseolinea sp.]